MPAMPAIPAAPGTSAAASAAAASGVIPFFWIASASFAYAALVFAAYAWIAGSFIVETSSFWSASHGSASSPGLMAFCCASIIVICSFIMSAWPGTMGAGATGVRAVGCCANATALVTTHKANVATDFDISGLLLFHFAL